MRIWRQRANRNLVFTKGPQYPFMMWIPRDHSPDPKLYQEATDKAGRKMNFTRIPISSTHDVWGFKDLTDQMRFCTDLKDMLTNDD